MDQPNNPTAPKESPDAETVPESDEATTLIVPPPNFRERLLAARQARAAESRASTDLRLPIDMQSTANKSSKTAE